MLSDTIKSLRKKKGLSQAQIAIKLGITQGAVSQWEHGLTEPASDQLLALAQIFGVSVYELKGVDEPKQKEPAAPGEMDEAFMVRVNQLSQENRALLDSQLDWLLSRQAKPES